MSPELTFIRPDDWHVHLRDGDLLGAVTASTAASFARAIVMPNLDPPVTSRDQADQYRNRILDTLPADSGFQPLMTCYLTDRTDSRDLRLGFEDGIFAAAKLYPAGATTNSASGVTDIRHLNSVLSAMQEIGMPLLVHGEVVDPEVDIFDREARFIDQVLEPQRREFPELKVVFEHITTANAVDYVLASSGNLAATITPHHLVINRNAMFDGGIRPHYYCLPVAKRESHRLALRRAATGGDPRFFLGTDSAPHLRGAKEAACGCAGIFNAPTAIATYLNVFEEEDHLENFEGFASLHGPAFYELPINTAKVTYKRQTEPVIPPTGYSHDIEIFAPRSHWLLHDE
ncbi:MAG: dihydroorotase [Pseudomonadota bacterium]